jgi:hypothetical protein
MYATTKNYLYRFWHTVKIIYHGLWKVFTVVNAEKKNIFVFLPVTFGEGP